MLLPAAPMLHPLSQSNALRLWPTLDSRERPSPQVAPPSALFHPAVGLCLFVHPAYRTVFSSCATCCPLPSHFGFNRPSGPAHPKQPEAAASHCVFGDTHGGVSNYHLGFPAELCAHALSCLLQGGPKPVAQGPHWQSCFKLRLVSPTNAEDVTQVDLLGSPTSKATRSQSSVLGFPSAAASTAQTELGQECMHML